MKMPNKHSMPKGRPTLRMEDGGQAAAALAHKQNMDTMARATSIYQSMSNPAVQVPRGPGMDRAGFLARNPGVVANQSASPSPGQLPLPGAGAGRGLINPAMATPGVSPLPQAGSGAFNPQTRMLRQTGFAGSAMGAPAAPKPIAPGIYQHSPNSFSDQVSGMGFGKNTGQPSAENDALMGAAAARSGQAPAGWTGGRVPTGFASTSNRYVGSAPPRASTAYMDDVNKGTFRAPIPMKNGGSLRTGMGGEVPGSGSGDKIPALYEPGEFVVSNDMLEADPSLQQHLSGLRETVLAEKGMTPEQADAKALSNPKGLRASTGAQYFGQILPSELLSADEAEMLSRAKNNPVGPGKTFTPNPSGSAAVQGPPTAPPANAPQVEEGKLPGYDKTGIGKPTLRARVMNGLGTAAAGATMFDAIEGSRTEDSTARYAKRFAMDEPTGDGSLGDIAKFTALRGLGYASDLGNNLTGGLAGKYLYRDEPGLSNTSFAAATISPVSPAPKAAAQPAVAAPVAKPAPSLRVPETEVATRKAERDAMTQRELALANRMQTDRMAQESAGYAAQEGQSRVDRGIARDLDRERARQRAESTLSSIMDTPAARAQKAAALATLKSLDDREEDLIKQDGETLRTGMNNRTSIRTTGMTTDATRYGSNMTHQLNMANALREQSNKDRDFYAGRNDKGLEQSGKAMESARKALTIYGRDKEGKPYVDEQQTNAAFELAQRQNPQWATLDPAEQAKHLTAARDITQLIGNLDKNQNNTWWQQYGLGTNNAKMDMLPMLEGAQIETLGVAGGAATAGAGRGDYKITLKDGKTLHLTRSEVSDGQLEFLQSQGVKIKKD